MDHFGVKNDERPIRCPFCDGLLRGGWAGAECDGCHREFDPFQFVNRRTVLRWTPEAILVAVEPRRS